MSMQTVVSDFGWQSSKGSVLERSSFMFNNPLLSDITITCGATKHKHFNAHKYVLATSSPVFYAMFYGESYAEKSRDSIHFEDVDDDSFEELLRFIYTDECQLSFNLAVTVLHQANKYLIPALASKCIDVLKENITTENVVLILQEALKFAVKDLEQKCWDIIDSQASSVLSCINDVMSKISQSTIHALLKRDTMKVREIELYQCVLVWLQHQCQQNGMEQTHENMRQLLGNAFWNIRFLSMSEAEFAHIVSGSGLLTAEESLTIFQKFNGLPNATFPWKQSSRGIDLKSFNRCSLLDIKPPDGSWSYGSGCPDRLAFCPTTKQIMLHGVHLFGSREAKYQVTLKLGKEIVTGIFSSEFVRRQTCTGSWFGFNVMLNSPMKIGKGVKVVMSAMIEGAASYYYESVQLQPDKPISDGNVSIQFYSSVLPANGTDISRGQFCELIYCDINE